MIELVNIREVQISDAQRLAEIYSFYVKNTAVSFEYEVPTADEFVKRIKHTREKYPYLVCVDDGKVVGYAYAGAYSVRQAYDRTVTTLIYVDKDVHNWVSDSPYLHAFDRLDEVHCQMEEQGLKKAMEEIGYGVLMVKSYGLPNGKELFRMDFKKERVIM